MVKLNVDLVSPIFHNFHNLEIISQFLTEYLNDVKTKMEIRRSYY